MYSYAILDDTNVVIDFANDYEEAVCKVNMSFWFTGIEIDQDRKAIFIGEKIGYLELLDIAKKGGAIFSDEYMHFLNEKYKN